MKPRLLAKARAEANLSRAKMAKLISAAEGIEVSADRIYRWEESDRVPEEYFGIVAKHYGIPADQLELAAAQRKEEKALYKSPSAWIRQKSPRRRPIAYENYYR